MVVGAVRPKWVSPQIAGFVVTFRFTPRARFRSEVPCDCGNLTGTVSPLMRPSAMIRQASCTFPQVW
jgi:hypothetical protein